MIEDLLNNPQLQGLLPLAAIFLLAVLVITLCLVLVFRSLPMGLVSMLPNLVPVVIAFGVWALLVGQMGVALAVVAAMSLGVVVDDTVHLTLSFLDARRRLRLGGPQLRILRL